MTQTITIRYRLYVDDPTPLVEEGWDLDRQHDAPPAGQGCRNLFLEV